MGSFLFVNVNEATPSKAGSTQMLLCVPMSDRSEGSGW